MDKRNYVPTMVPRKGYVTSIEHAEIVVRDYDGTPIVVAEGIHESHQGEAGHTFVLSPHAFEQMIETWTRKMLERSSEEKSDVPNDEPAWTADTERIVRDRARDFADELFTSTNDVDTNDSKTIAWSKYKQSLMIEFREVAENAFEQRMKELFGNERFIKF